MIYNDQAIHLRGKFFNVLKPDALVSFDFVKALVEEFVGNLRSEQYEVKKAIVEVFYDENAGIEAVFILDRGAVNFRSFSEQGSAFVDFRLHGKVFFGDMLSGWKVFVKNFEAKNNSYDIAFRA